MVRAARAALCAVGTDMGDLLHEVGEVVDNSLVEVGIFREDDASGTQQRTECRVADETASVAAACVSYFPLFIADEKSGGHENLVCPIERLFGGFVLLVGLPTRPTPRLSVKVPCLPNRETFYFQANPASFGEGPQATPCPAWEVDFTAASRCRL